MTIQEIQTLVQQAPGSMYTREDVISLLNRITFPDARLTKPLQTPNTDPYRDWEKIGRAHV